MLPFPFVCTFKFIFIGICINSNLYYQKFILTKIHINKNLYFPKFILTKKFILAECTLAEAV
jgi:hypothetical protein